MKYIQIILITVLFACEKPANEETQRNQNQDSTTSAYTGTYAGYDNNVGGTSYVTASVWDSAGVTWYFSHGNELYPDTFEIQIANDTIFIPVYSHILPDGAAKWIHGEGTVKGDTLDIAYQVDFHNTGNDHLVWGFMKLVKQ